MNKEELTKKVKELGPWFHQIDLGQGVLTRSVYPTKGGQPIDHPKKRWDKIKDFLPEDLSGMRIFDIGCSDGFFAIEMARRGAKEIICIDNAKKMIARLDWMKDYLNLPAIKPQVGSIYKLPNNLGKFDFVFMFALLYHLKEPLFGLEIVSKYSDKLYLESLAVNDEENSHLQYMAPEEGVHPNPKWFPTTRCIKDMLKWAGYSKITEVASAEDQRPIYYAEK